VKMTGKGVTILTRAGGGTGIDYSISITYGTRPQCQSISKLP